jgi:hypothetical protein
MWSSISARVRSSSAHTGPPQEGHSRGRASHALAGAHQPQARSQKNAFRFLIVLHSATTS